MTLTEAVMSPTCSRPPVLSPLLLSPPLTAVPDLGPYTPAYSRNGRSLILAGHKGHVALLDWKRCHIVAEMQVLRDNNLRYSNWSISASQETACGGHALCQAEGYSGNVVYLHLD